MVVGSAEIFEHDGAWIIIVVFGRGEAARQRRRPEDRRKLAVELYLGASIAKRRERRFDDQAPGQVYRGVSRVRDRKKDELRDSSLEFEFEAHCGDCAARQRPRAA